MEGLEVLRQEVLFEYRINDESWIPWLTLMTNDL